MSEKSPIDVGYVAKLARIEITESERSKLQQDMQNVVGYIELLNELDVTNIEPTAHAAQLSNVWREDVSGTSFARSEMLKNAPATLDGETIKVPQVLADEGIN